MTAIALKRHHTLDWVKICHAAKRVGLAAFFFALGGWVVSIRDQAARLPYREKATAAYENLAKVSGGDPGKLVDCAKKARKTAAVANQAIVSNYNPAVPVPHLAEVQDCGKPSAPAQK